MKRAESGMPASADAVVIGAGLGGLATAIRLQQHGLAVVLIERLDRVGGLCGSFLHDDGYRYVIACNDFGKGLLGDLAQLGIEHRFERSATRIFTGERNYRLPPDLRTVAGLLPHAGAILRYVRGLRRARAAGHLRPGSLVELIDDCRISGRAADLLMLPAYLMGVAPDRFRLDALDDEFHYGYGYATPITPVGGPQALADAFRDRFLALGGQLLLGCEMLGIDQNASRNLVQTTGGPLAADIVVSTLPKPGHHPERFAPGLALSMLLLRIDSRHALPAGIHTHVYYPPDIRHWFRDLYEGRLPTEFGFHFFSSDLGDQGGVRTANVYFYLPAGREDDPRVQQLARAFVLLRLETLLPGITGQLRGATLLAPADFRARHGLDSRVTPVITPAGFAKPANHCARTGIYYAGAAAHPPGEHAGAAVRSSGYVCELVMKRMKETLHAN
ncbi:phytoene desaturase family protein [Derxia lacustris]|uniref:phytoene desaturase family protein n=1 Tax=Derxia lacustris TaxID=764842 RepID=UPI000A175867|nr:FAD-dependent oxidoreductase [Derxia lacustris]